MNTARYGVSQSYSESHQQLLGKIYDNLNKGPILLSCISSEDLELSRLKKLKTNDHEVQITSSLMPLDVYSLQNKLIQFEEPIPNIHKQIEFCNVNDKNLVVEDALFFELCRKAPSMSSSFRILMAKLIVYPKLSSFHKEIPEKILTVIKDNFKKDTEVLVDVICALLKTQNRQIYYGLLSNCITFSGHANCLNILRILLELENVSEDDIQLIQILVDNLDFTNECLQEHFIKILEKLAPNFIKSIKFGRCLLKFLKKMPSLPQNQLQIVSQIIVMHSSVMKAVLQTQLKKIQ